MVTLTLRTLAGQARRSDIATVTNKAKPLPGFKTMHSHTFPTARARLNASYLNLTLWTLQGWVAMFFIVFGLQEGQSNDWAPWIWAMLAIGVALMVVFGYWQSVNPNEPLIPLRIFADRDFTLSTIGVAVIGFAVTAMILPVMFYAPAVLGLSYTRSALLTAPMAVASGVLAPFVGRMVDRRHPTPIIGFGFSLLAIRLEISAVSTTPGRIALTRIL